ncbi:hypothetical protein GC170_01685 [bacterium]|nr:hypothetical protein [bacterium]
MHNRIMTRAALLFLLTTFLTIPARAVDVYAIANLSGDQYQFGSFDLSNPDTSGGSGNFTYTWSSLGSVSSATLGNVVYDSTTSQMYITSGSYEFRTIDTAGNQGPILGYLLNSMYGMAFDTSGTLAGVNYSTAQVISPVDASTISSANLSTNATTQFPGFLTYSPSAGYLIANYGSPSTLQNVALNGNLTPIGTFSGTGFDDTQSMSLFASGNSVYMLNGERLYSVNTSDATLTRLGTIVNLPAEFANGFSGAVAVPEPSSVLLGFLAVASTLLACRKSRKS